MAGNFLFAGHLVEAPDLTIWDISMPDPGLRGRGAGLRLAGRSGGGRRRGGAQAGAGLDLGLDRALRARAGAGLDARPDRAAGDPLDQPRAVADERARPHGDGRLFRALSRQTVFLSRRWQTAAPGLPRFEALTGLIYAGLALTGMERAGRPGPRRRWRRNARREIDARGRHPHAQPRGTAGGFHPADLGRAGADRDGTAARARASGGDRADRARPCARCAMPTAGWRGFTAAGAGMEGRLDQALASSGVKRRAGARAWRWALRGCRAGAPRVIVDAAAPPDGRAATSAHASTLAFELTSGRRPLIVTCGSGAPFGPDWRRAGRATAIAFDAGDRGLFVVAPWPPAGASRLTDRARVTALSRTRRTARGRRSLVASHDGWVAHPRADPCAADWTCRHDGRRLTGEDVLAAMSAPAQRRVRAGDDRYAACRACASACASTCIPMSMPRWTWAARAVSLALKSGEIWVFRHDGRAEADAGTIGLSGKGPPEAARDAGRSSCRRVMRAFEAQIGWTLAKAQDTPLAIRDLDRDDLPVLT